tara:strand:+ start:123 stop:476 length:354 start_codon:yes stop_codon:yes gene_type:complete
MLSQFINELPIWALPRETVHARTVLMGRDMPTDRVYFLKEGRAKGKDGCLYHDLHVLNFKEFLALSTYQTSVTCLDICELIYIPRQLVKDQLCLENTSTWTLVRSLALDHLMLKASA